jgi:hypothetical protein
MKPRYYDTPGGNRYRILDSRLLTLLKRIKCWLAGLTRRL